MSDHLDELLSQDQQDEIIADAVEAGKATVPPLPPSHHAARPWWRHKWVWVATVAALVIIACVMVLALVATSAQGDARSATDAVAALAQQVRDLGGTPVIEPSQVPGPTGPAGAQGPGPTDAQVAAAVSLFCASHSNCTGTPSQAQVAAAVRAYCTDGACTGPKGSAGSSGVAGAAGAAGATGQAGAGGAQGPGPTSDEVAAAVAAYCSAHGDCTGPAGQQGSAGPRGDTGASGAAGYPPGEIDIDVPDVLGGTTREYCTPNSDAGPGDQPVYSCSTSSPAASAPSSGAS